MSRERFQTVYLTLSDGRKGAFMGKELITREEEALNLSLTEITFARSRELPEGMYFEEVVDDQKEGVH